MVSRLQRSFYCLAISRPYGQPFGLQIETSDLDKPGLKPGPTWLYSMLGIGGQGLDELVHEFDALIKCLHGNALIFAVCANIIRISEHS
jgi:hypothetical protein